MDHTVGIWHSRVYGKRHCGIQPLAQAADLVEVRRSTQPSAPRGMTKWVSAFRLSNNNNNNNNNNNEDNVYGAVIMAEPLREFTGSFDECRMAPSGRRPKTKPNHLGCESAYTGCQSLHPASPFIIITQPESWYSFYHPTDGRRLSRPSWLVNYRDGLPV